MTLYVVINQSQLVEGLYAMRRSSQVVYINRISGAFVYVGSDLFSNKFKLRDLDKKNITFWKNLLIKKRELYLSLEYDFCVETIDTLNKNLGNAYLSLIIKEPKKCQLCLEDINGGTMMISFHAETQDHLCCTPCFDIYGKLVCPVCEKNK